ncbi:aminodeoxychorismate synthase component I [Dietzia cinnamea]|uniref:aminodeoxychorismate synthase component I n=1 Tax=Dietzia cinnamea TaxID=321318 RepID=UPI0021AEA27C|nr:aminodeoxychorismate synthase component I [Dietzia cinnamea]MCT1712025.1 aminodeoxychorismate synthase component I [Dietzia cinnamea]MCT2265651.1 aminodeoxychorismate synthase component I [Dietzia cinnamea]
MHTWAEMPPDPLGVLNACARRAEREGLPPPAAFLGDWLGAAAVIAPSARLAPVAPADAFGTDALVVVDPDADPRADGSPGTPPATDGSPGTDADPGLTLGFRSYPDVPSGARRLLPEAVSGRADGVLVLGHDGRWTARGTVPDARELAPGPGGGGDDDEVPTLDWDAPDREAHRASVTACLEAIRAGEIYQACLSTRLDGHLHGEPIALFSALWRRTRARRAAYLAGEWGAVVSLSPETYLTRRGRDVLSAPIKGTLPLDADPALLRASTKDVAENIMIVDLVRHDLGRTADLGTVSVPELLAVHPAPGVWHLVSTVAARTGVPHDELVETTFPPASVTGTPKLRARELISGWEPRARGLHCGAIGLAGPGVLDLSVAIRTLEIGPDGRCEFGVGGGITIDSDPDAEWDECVHKAAFTWGGGDAPWAG